MLRPFHCFGVAAALLAAQAQAQTVGFATLPPGSILHAQASVIAKVVQDNSRLQVRVIGYGGDTGVLEAVDAKKSDFWLLDVGESADALPFARAHDAGRIGCRETGDRKALHAVGQRKRRAFAHSHSIVPGGLLV